MKQSTMIVDNRVAAESLASELSTFAVDALLEELYLTPKPGLVDRRNNGSHHDLSVPLMESSARSLEPCFYEMVMAGTGKKPTQQLREQLAAIGRFAEQEMLGATGRVNAHKGAIWALGLLCGAAGVVLSQPEHIGRERYHFLVTAGAIASFDDRFSVGHNTNGNNVRKKYMVRCARQEAMACFPALRDAGLPAWDKYKGEPDNIRKLNTLLALMSVVDDTCILHRSNMEVLCEVKRRSAQIMARGGLGFLGNWQLYHSLDHHVSEQWVSPGGSADLLATILFLDKIMHHQLKK